MMGSVYVAKNTPNILCHPMVWCITEPGSFCTSLQVHRHPQKSWRANGKNWFSVLNISFMPLLHKLQEGVLLLGYTATVHLWNLNWFQTLPVQAILKKQQKTVGYQYTVTKTMWNFRWEGQRCRMKKVATDISFKPVLESELNLHRSVHSWHF